MKRLLPNCWQDWMIIAVVGTAIVLMLIGCSIQVTHNYRVDWWTKHTRSVTESNHTTLP